MSAGDVSWRLPFPKGTRGGVTKKSDTSSADWPLETGVGARAKHDRDATVRLIWSSPEQIFDAHYRRLVDALAVAAADRDVAADAVQEAFAKLVVSWNRVSKYEDPVGWLRRVALNHIFDYRRLLLRRASALVRLAGQDEANDPGLDVWPAVPEEVLALPVRQRTAIALHYVADLTIPEVARAMGLTEGSVNQHLHRARQTLRNIWGEHEGS